MFITIARPGGASRGLVEHSKGKGGESAVAILRFLCRSPCLYQLRTASFWLRWQTLICTGCTSGFYAAQ
jgi:hypothetical protein